MLEKVEFHACRMLIQLSEKNDVTQETNGGGNRLPPHPAGV